MLNIIRAELYRFRNSGGFLYYMAAVAVLGILTIFSIDLNALDADLGTTMFNMAQFVYSLILLGSGTLLTIFVGIAYNNRMAYYEIMSGNAPHKIILSKVLSLGLISSLIIYIPTAAFLAFTYFRNGKGEAEDPVLLFVLLFVITLHLTVSFILYAMLGRNLVLASFVPYIRFGLLDLIVYMLISQEFEKFQDSKLLFLTTNSQMANLTQLAGNKDLITVIILTSVIECTVLYVLVYLVYKNKKFK